MYSAFTYWYNVFFFAQQKKALCSDFGPNSLWCIWKHGKEPCHAYKNPGKPRWASWWHRAWISTRCHQMTATKGGSCFGMILLVLAYSCQKHDPHPPCCFLMVSGTDLLCMILFSAYCKGRRGLPGLLYAWQGFFPCFQIHHRLFGPKADHI